MLIAQSMSREVQVPRLCSSADPAMDAVYSGPVVCSLRHYFSQFIRPDFCVVELGASNVLEHLEKADVAATLHQLRSKLKPGGQLCIVGPNYRFCSAEYFEDYTHVSAFSDRSLAGLPASARVQGGSSGSPLDAPHDQVPPSCVRAVNQALPHDSD